MCIFCKIVNKEIPADIVYESAQILAFRDINPQAPIHIVLITKKHIGSLQQIASEDLSLMQAVTQAAQAIAKAEGISESGYRLVTNIGENSGQTVPHLHFHILGGRYLSWPPG